ncbi:MAG: hypothetical protein DI545_00440 [Micrococcus luteus]|nr:MAG: hypothetical protein DI545_00440 [Micrococcus luteus]
MHHEGGLPCRAAPPFSCRLSSSAARRRTPRRPWRSGRGRLDGPPAHPANPAAPDPGAVAPARPPGRARHLGAHAASPRPHAACARRPPRADRR